MVVPSNNTCPSVVTTWEGMGGALRRTLIPTPPKTAKDMTSTRPRAIQSFLYAMSEHLSFVAFPVSAIFPALLPGETKCCFQDECAGAGRPPAPPAFYTGFDSSRRRRVEA